MKRHLKIHERFLGVIDNLTHREFFRHFIQHTRVPAIFVLLLSPILLRVGADPEFAETFDLISPGDIVVEIGSNVGGLTEALSRTVGLEGHVYAIEPNILAFHVLRLRMRKARNVTCVNVGIDQTEGKGLLFMGGPTDKGASLSTNHRGLRGYMTEVPLMTLDKLIDALHLNRLSVVLMDAEGYELRILKGGHRTLTDFRPSFVIELHADVDPLIQQGVVSLATRYMYTTTTVPTSNVSNPVIILTRKNLD